MMGQPVIPVHRLYIGWICLSIGCIFTIFCMFKLWFDFRKIATAHSVQENSKKSVISNSKEQSKESSDPKSRSESPKSSQSDSHPKGPKISSRLMWLIWCTLLCYFIFNAYVLISRLYVFVIAQDKVNFPCFIWVLPQIISFMSGRMFLYLLWCDRFCSVFSNSAFEKTHRFQYIMTFGIVGSMLFSMSFYLIIYGLYAGNDCQLSGDKGHLLIAALPFTLFDLIWSVVILYLFVGHLYKLLRLSLDGGAAKKVEAIYKVIKRLNILVNISILSTWLILISIYSYVPLSASSIDGIINTICILFSLKRYNNMYMKICFICINYYESCFMKFCCCCCEWCHKVNEEKKSDINMLALEVSN